MPPFPIAKLAAKNIKLMRPTVMAYIATREEYEYYVNELFDWLKSGKLKVNVHKAYDLSDIQQAHKDLEGRVTSGKLLVKIA